jgi:hypothetical protein
MLITFRFLWLGGHMNTVEHQSSEGGQVLVLIVLAVVVLLGFTALAVDGSMAYSDRRQSQNSADASSLGGGGKAALLLENSPIRYWNWNCSDGAVISATNQARTIAAQRASDNGFNLAPGDSDLSDRQGIDVRCTNLDTSSTWPEKYIDFEVQLSRDTPASFSQFIFSGPLRNSVIAVTRIRPRSSLAFGNAIVALDPATHCSTVNLSAGFHGSTDITVSGGGIFSNGCLVAKDAALTVEVHQAGVVYGTELNLHDTGTIALDPGYTITKTPEPLPLDQFALDTEPNCADAAAHNYSADEFETDAMDGGGLSPGLYCVDGDVEFNAGDYVAGLGVTIVLRSGKFTVNGGATVVLTAPPPDAPAPAIPGLLFYGPPGYTGPVKLNGNENSVYQGTILFPTASIDFEGTGANAGILKSQIIGWDVRIGGTSSVQVEFSGEENYSRPTSLELYR